MKENPVVKNLKCVVGSGKGKEDLANSLLQFAKSHMESMNQQTGGAMYRKELEDVDRYMKDPNALQQDLERERRSTMPCADFATDPNMEDPTYRAAKEKYDHYVQMVEEGNYEDPDQMIALYEALLDTVPAGSLLYRKICEEIDAHEADKIADLL